MQHCLEGLRTSARKMPFQFEFDPAHQVMRTRFSGLVNDAQLAGFYAAAPGYLTQCGAHAGIIDFCEVTAFQVSPAAITALAMSPPVTKDRFFVRVVVAPTPQVFGLSRMFQILGEHTRPGLTVVHTREDANAVLNIKNPQFEPLAGK